MVCDLAKFAYMCSICSVRRSVKLLSAANKILVFDYAKSFIVACWLGT